MADRVEKLKKEITKNGNIPGHVAVIMDGNGRWAKSKGFPRIAGHKEGINSVREIARAAGEIGVKVLTLYTFSKENWKRPRREVSFLMSLLPITIKNEIRDLMKNNVKITAIGNLDDLPDRSLKAIKNAINTTKNNTGLNLNLALSYSSRDEILNAIKNVVSDVQIGKILVSDINEKLFSEYLFTKNIPDPDLLIRTSGELRISNYLLWQIAYTEIYITKVYWPEFRSLQFYEAIADFQTRERRFGKLSEQISNSK